MDRIGQFPAPLPPGAGAPSAPAPAGPAEEQAAPRHAAPKRDRYTPEEPRVPTGRYWPVQKGDGSSGIFFDDPGRRSGEPAVPAKGEKTVADTDRVDGEIRRLKRERAQLEQRLQQADPERREQIERRLEQLERELAQKDTDSYRRAHTVFTAGPA